MWLIKSKDKRLNYEKVFKCIALYLLINLQYYADVVNVFVVDNF